MKEYNRTTKKYEEVTNIKLKKRELCKGEKPHDYVLVLPDHETYDENYKFNPEKYYEILEDLGRYEEMVAKSLIEMGIKSRYGRFVMSRWVHRHYICSVCKKKKYD